MSTWPTPGARASCILWRRGNETRNDERFRSLRDHSSFRILWVVGSFALPVAGALVVLLLFAAHSWVNGIAFTIIYFTEGRSKSVKTLKEELQAIADGKIPLTKAQTKALSKEALYRLGGGDESVVIRIVWLCVRGHPGRIARDVRQIVAADPAEWSELATTDVVARIRRHCAKPEAIQDEIKRLVPGPYLEMFARRPRPGWTCIGGEVTGRDIREDLALLRDAQALPSESGLPVRALAQQQQLLWE